MAKILIVDDSWVARLGMSKLLTTLGHEVLEAAEGQQAIDVLNAQSPAAVFLDLLMPGLDGYGVLQALQERGVHVPIFVLSADIQDSTLKKCLALGARGCLPKPPTRESVEAALKDWT